MKFKLGDLVYWERKDLIGKVVSQRLAFTETNQILSIESLRGDKFSAEDCFSVNSCYVKPVTPDWIDNYEKESILKLRRLTDKLRGELKEKVS